MSTKYEFEWGSPKCPCIDSQHPCVGVWAQMPYQKEDGDGDSDE